MERFVIAVSFLLSLVACDVNVIDSTKDSVGEVKGIVRADVSYDGFQLSTNSCDTTINSNCFAARVLGNKHIQTFAVNDGESLYLMARSPLNKSGQIEIDARSTALAMVTMHPVFALADASEYEDLVSYIESSSKFEAFYRQILSAVNARRNILDDANEPLIVSLNDLLEDLCNNIDEQAYDDTLMTIYNPGVATRVTYVSPRLNPAYIYADITGNILTLKTAGLTPTYYGTVTDKNGGTQSLAIRSRDDFGGMDLFTETVESWRYGDPMVYKFTESGEHDFSFSRVTPAATVDFWIRLTNTLLAIISLDLPAEVAQEVASSVGVAMLSAGTGVSDHVISPMNWIGIAYDAVLTQLKTGRFFGLGVSDSFIYGAHFLSGLLNLYNKCKGTANGVARIKYALDAPEQFDFCLCYYSGEVTTCSRASIEKTGGDNQKGYYKQRLLEPLEVSVFTIDENGNGMDTPNYHRVKFEVTKGGGRVDGELVTADSDAKASTYWTLGESGKQEVKAVVIDVITGEEISNPVYFNAETETAEITVRLDWSQHSGNTDIDLHVVDPDGERIFYSHMSSASGGYLDRDDRHGPGPEHIHWDNAISGTYVVYVHYYPNGDEDKSVVSYTVTVTASGKSYRPKSGSISYDQMIPVGQFTIGEESATRSELDNVRDAPHQFVTILKESL